MSKLIFANKWCAWLLTLYLVIGMQLSLSHLLPHSLLYGPTCRPSLSSPSPFPHVLVQIAFFVPLVRWHISAQHYATRPCWSMDPIAAKAETEDTGSPMVSCHNALVRFVVFGKLAELFLSSYLGCRICLGAGIYTRHVFLATSKNDNLCFF